MSREETSHLFTGSRNRMNNTHSSFLLAYLSCVLTASVKNQHLKAVKTQQQVMSAAILCPAVSISITITGSVHV